MKIIITGTAGFIGYSLSKKLLERGDYIIGIDNHNDYYDPEIKESRYKNLSNYKNYFHHRIDLIDQNNLNKVFEKNNAKIVVNLAAQAGVRYSIKNPHITSKVTYLAFIIF